MSTGDSSTPPSRRSGPGSVTWRARPKRASSLIVGPVRLPLVSTQAARRCARGDDRLRRQPPGLRAAVHVARIGVRLMLAGEVDRRGGRRRGGGAVALLPDQPAEASQLAGAEVDIGA